MGELIEIPARGGKAVRVKKGQALKMINTHGHQVVDTWAFNAEDLTEFMSMEHLRAMLGTIFPKQGDSLYTNQRRPILVMEEDTSPGIHDTLMASCDVHRYRLLGCTEYHENCTDNLAASMKELGLVAPETPAPLNMWMNIPVADGGATSWEAPVSKAGDHVLLRAQMDCIVAMSACPQDIIPVNAGNPVEAHFEVLD
ncbi:urea carboxylase-associated family protein [Hwanghaeella grinnelliae]|uniref:Urea carboxylase-associated family protein n=1 Tax=Hwanghaeella grinnelliae TaxID=2500179 RepID=A0A3S2WPT3_9PROT|nr:urea carboxylase-associated family protein [Hwanghaeella grinnelliae]RVU34229.1 urea carboxylase-associated family protein [Hwanghaeella grinnelliae]